MTLIWPHLLLVLEIWSMFDNVPVFCVPFVVGSLYYINAQKIG